MGVMCGKKAPFFYLNPLVAIDIDDMDSFKLSELIFKNKSSLVKKKNYYG